MDGDQGFHLDDQPPAHPPPRPPSDELPASQPQSPVSPISPTGSGGGYVRKTSMPLEQQSSWRRNPVKRRKKTLDENCHKVKPDADAAAINTTVDNPKTSFKSVVGRHSLVMKQTPGGAELLNATAVDAAFTTDEKPIPTAPSKRPTKEKHRRSKSDTKLLKASCVLLPRHSPHSFSQSPLLFDNTNGLQY